MIELDYDRESFDIALKTCAAIQETCRAWIEFLKRENLNHLLANEARCTVFSESGCFQQMRIALGCREKEARMLILSLATQTIPKPFKFMRWDIFDKMAYAPIPLNCFTKTTSNAKVVFAIAEPMVFAATSFVLKHQKTKWGDKRWGRLYCTDGRLKTSREHPREVAEKRNFDIDATRQLMFAELLEKVKEREASGLFTISGDSLIGAIIKQQSDAAKLPAETAVDLELV